MQPFELRRAKWEIFYRLKSSKITPAKGKERRKGKGEEKERRRREKNNVSLLAFILATYFGKLFGGKGLQFGGNVFKTLARHVHASVIALPKAVLQR